MKLFMKRFASIALIIIMVMSLVACGKKEEKTTEATTTEDADDVDIDIADDTDVEEMATELDAMAPPADIVTPEASTEDIIDDTEEEVEVADNGKVIFKGVTMQLPEGYVYNPDSSSIDAACFLNSESETALVLCVDSNNTAYDESNYETVFDSQITAIYGDNVTHSPVTINDNECIEWVLDNVDEGTYGRALAIIDGKMLIYIEFFGFGDHIADYKTAVETLEY